MMTVYFNSLVEEKKIWIAKDSLKETESKVSDLDIQSFKFFDKNLDLGFSSFSVAKVFSEEKQIIAKRDIFGSIPLFFFWKKNEFCVLSEEVSVLLSYQEGLLDKERIDYYLNNVDLDKLKKSYMTFFKDIYQVPAGSVVTIKCDSIQIAYIDYQSTSTKGNLHKELKKSIENLIHNKEKVAFHVSGGLDSTSLASIQASLKLKNIETHYCVAKTEFKSTSERVFQKSFAKKYRVKINTYSTHANLLRLTKEYCKVAYQPPLLFNTISLFDETLKSLKKRNINALVSGHAGDQVLGHGFDYIKKLKKERRYKKINSFVKLLSQQGLLKNNFENWHNYGINKKFNLTLQTFVYPINSFLKKDGVLTIWQYLAVGGNIFFVFTAGLNSVFNKIFRKRKSPILISTKYQKNQDIYIGHKNKNHEEIQNNSFSNMNETFYNLSKLYNIQFLFPFLNTRVYAASNAYSQRDKFGEGRGREHLRIELKGVLPELVRKRIGKASFDEYFVHEIESYVKQMGEIDEEHLIWKFVNKRGFYERINELINNKKSYFSKKYAAHFVHRVLNIKVWLDFLTNINQI